VHSGGNESMTAHHICTSVFDVSHRSNDSGEPILCLKVCAYSKLKVCAYSKLTGLLYLCLLSILVILVVLVNNCCSSLQQMIVTFLLNNCYHISRSNRP